MAQEPATIDSVMNLAEAMNNMDGDTELLQEIIGVFMQTGPEQLDRLENGIAAGAVQDVMVKAHGMKGGASNFCARRFVAAALQLELLAKGGSLVGAMSRLEAMRIAFAELQELVVLINWDEVAQNWKA